MFSISKDILHVEAALEDLSYCQSPGLGGLLSLVRGNLHSLAEQVQQLERAVQTSVRHNSVAVSDTVTLFVMQTDHEKGGASGQHRALPESKKNGVAQEAEKEEHLPEIALLMEWPEVCCDRLQ